MQRERMKNAVEGEVEMARQRLESLRSRRVLTNPSERLQPLRERVVLRRRQAREIVRGRVKIEAQIVRTRRAQLSALDPNRVLERGYALISQTKNGAFGFESGRSARTRFDDYAARRNIKCHTKLKL